MGRQRWLPARRGRKPPEPRWRIREPRKGELCRHRLGDRRHRPVDDYQLGVGMIGLGLFWLVLATVLMFVVPDKDGGDIVALVFGWVIGLVWGAFGRWILRDAASQLRRAEDRVWLDDRDLWWVRLHPAAAGAEPTRVSRDEVVEVGLGEYDRTVVVRTVDGRTETVTDLGSRAERVALATAIGDAIAPGVARVHPKLPPDLPARWTVADDGGEIVLWRRPFPGLRWLKLTVGIVAGVPLIVAAIVHIVMFSPLFFLPVLGVAFLFTWLDGVLDRSVDGWVVQAGQLDAESVDTGSGREYMPRRVVALEIHGGVGFTRLWAVLATGDRLPVMAGRARRVRALARWLADRADVPINGRDRDDVASRQVNL